MLSLFSIVGAHQSNFNIDAPWVKKLLGAQSERNLSPPAFRYQLIEKAKKARKQIVLPEGEEPRIIKAASICAQRKIAQPILLGNPEKIQDIAKKKWDYTYPRYSNTRSKAPKRKISPFSDGASKTQGDHRKKCL